MSTLAKRTPALTRFALRQGHSHHCHNRHQATHSYAIPEHQSLKICGSDQQYVAVDLTNARQHLREGLDARLPRLGLAAIRP